MLGLSYAQQMKNKDIPEGGSKAVLLMNTPAITSQSTK
jgi:NAD-specific glutamate dehydrogenase